MKYEAVIGLEVHAQLLTESKLFCSCSARFGAEPNENTCPVCLGLPGALPVLNEKVVDLGLRAALALECNVPPASVFARKNYFYPDLPKGYQISQFDQPLCVEGRLEISGETGGKKTIRIKRIHLEEDAGKLLHEGIEPGVQASFVDLNRSGVPLIEIVSEPDLSTSDEAYEYLSALKAILRYAGISSANMEEGNLRCDANVSIRPASSEGLGTKVEIKNMNSFKNVQRALDHEIGRQTRALEAGEKIVQETRLFDADRGTTHPMRSKEEAHDYRYFPEPDLLPLSIHGELLEKIRASMPELPAQKRQRFIAEYQLTPAEAEVITQEPDLALFYEDAVRLSKEPKQTANWILRDLLKLLKDTGMDIEKSSVKPAHIADLVQLISNGTVSSNQGKEIFVEMAQTGTMPAEIVRQKGLAQISGKDEIGTIVDEILSKNEDLVTRYRGGEAKLLGVLVGQVMKASGGKANPGLVSQILKEKLG